jgi:23S rRNA (guanosine2251-2'-O)-methyltransferase
MGRRKETDPARQRRWHARGAKPGVPTSPPREEWRERRGEAEKAPWLYGRHVAAMVLANPARRLRRLVALPESAEWLAEKRRAGKARAPEIEILNRAEFELLVPEGAVHQGVALLPEAVAELAIEDVIERAGERATVVLLDRVSDPHNVGAVLRSAAVFGALALVVPEHGAPEVTGVLAKSASGALEHVPIVRVVNLARTMDALKQAGFWCVGLDETAERTLAEVAPKGRVALALGAEGAGLRRLTRERCDVVARLPALGAIASLNVSNAAAVALYELVRDGG